MISYRIQFDDGEFIKYAKTLQEAMDYRNEHNFKYISRSIHIYATYRSKCIGCQLNKSPLIVKIV